jgi:alkaline phosphatase
MVTEKIMRPGVLVAAAALSCAAVPAWPQLQQDTAAYRAQGEAGLARLKATSAPETKARNVIIFIGDGMGVSTITAARIFAGQALGRGRGVLSGSDGQPRSYRARQKPIHMTRR